MTLFRLFLCLCVGIAFSTVNVSSGCAEEKVVRAKVGVSVESEGRQLRAKANERLAAGDHLRVYVYPEEDCYVYVIHADQKTATLLKTVEKNVPAGLLVLPSQKEFYEVDGKSLVETFTVVCSPEELKEISTLFNSGPSYENWASLEKELIKKGEIDLGDKPDKPFAIAGNVRGLPESGPGDSFLSELQVYSGNGILVKRYEFTVKNQ